MDGFEALFFFQVIFAYMLGYLLPLINKGFILSSLLLSILLSSLKGRYLHLVFILLYFIGGSVRGVLVGPRVPETNFVSGGERVRFRGTLSDAYQMGALTLLVIERGKLSTIERKKSERYLPMLAVKVFGPVEAYRKRRGETLIGIGRVSSTSQDDRRFFFPMEMLLKGIPYTVNSTWDKILYFGDGRENTLREKIVKKLTSALPGEGAHNGGREFVISILTGEKSFRGPLRNHLRESGLSHLQAISGLHVGVAMIIFSLFMRSLLAFVQMRGYVCDGNPLSLFTALGATFFYAYISGMAFPVLRSFAMMIFALCAVRNSNGSRLLAPFGFSLFIVLISHPSGIASVSFIFSFLLTFYIILLFRCVPGRQTGWVTKSVLVATTCYLSSFPLVILFFRQVQIWSFIFNMLFVPLFTPVIALSLLWAAGYLIFPPIFFPLAGIPVWCADHLLFMVDKLRIFLGGWMIPENPGIGRVGIYLGALAIIILLSTAGKIVGEEEG